MNSLKLLTNKKTISLKYMIDIAEESSTLTERLKTTLILNQQPSSNEIINSRIANWCQLVTEGNQEKFEKRLDWDSLDLNTIRGVLGSVRLVDKQNLPVWAETFKAALEATDLGTLEGKKNHCLNHEKPLPFEEIFLPFIYVARQKLKAEAGSS